MKLPTLVGCDRCDNQFPLKDFQIKPVLVKKLFRPDETRHHLFYTCPICTQVFYIDLGPGDVSIAGDNYGGLSIGKMTISGGGSVNVSGGDINIRNSSRK